MHLLLTDRLSCPRCGPEFGLVLLADRMVDRRVHEGTLGCPNCRDVFPVRDGFGDLRAPPRRELSAGLAGAPRDQEPEAAGRLAALVGVAQGPGTVALVGGPAAHGPALAAMLEGVDFVGVDADLGGWPEVGAWSRIVSAPGLPFYSRTLRGVAVDGRLGPEWIAEAARVVAPLARVVVVEAPDGAEQALEAGGLQVMAREPGTIVATRR